MINVIAGRKEEKHELVAGLVVLEDFSKME